MMDVLYIYIQALRDDLIHGRFSQQFQHRTQQISRFSHGLATCSHCGGKLEYDYISWVAAIFSDGGTILGNQTVLVFIDPLTAPRLGFFLFEPILFGTCLIKRKALTASVVVILILVGLQHWTWLNCFHQDKNNNNNNKNQNNSCNLVLEPKRAFCNSNNYQNLCSCTETPKNRSTAIEDYRAYIQ